MSSAIFFESKSVGIWYSIISPVLGLRRISRSAVLLVAYTWPFLSGADTAYGVMYFCVGHS